MDRNEAIKLIDERMCFGRGKWSEHHVPEIDDYWKAGKMAIEALVGKDTNVPSNSALDHIHNVVRDDAYRRGYEQGKKDAETIEAIPVDWLENFLREEYNKGFESDALLVAYGIIILCKWKGEANG